MWGSESSSAPAHVVRVQSGSAAHASVMSSNRVFVSPKVPEVFLVFWVIKLLTTGIGETSADFMGSHSIPVAGVVGVGGFFAALWWQLRADSYQDRKSVV